MFVMVVVVNVVVQAFDKLFQSQDVDWDLCSNTSSSIVQAIGDIDVESLVSILFL
jgi:hypothetical protein